MAREYPTILELVGATPIVRLDKLSHAGGAQILAKLEYLNPGGSVKDRIGLPMIEAAERDGKLKPGGTIVEPTSGNTGVGLAIGAALKGYRCIFVMPDKMSQEKISLLRAYGAEVVITPTAVDHDSPECYYSVSRSARGGDPRRLQAGPVLEPEQPGAHYRTTGPEIWEQTGRRDRRDRRLRRHRRHDQRRRPLLQGAQAGGADRRRRPGGLGVHGEERRRPASVLRRGHRQGHVAEDDGPDGRRRVGARLRPRLVPLGAQARARGRHPRRRLGRHVDVRGACDREAARTRASAC